MMESETAVVVIVLILLSLFLGFMLGIGQESCQEPEPCECPQLSYTNVTECLMELETCQSDLNKTMRFNEYYKNKLEDAKDE